VAYGAVSALGEQGEAVGATDAGSVARLAIRRDEELARAGLARPFAARVAIADKDQRARRILHRAVDLCVAELERAGIAWRQRRVGLVLGTACGGMQEAEEVFAELARGQTGRALEESSYWGPAIPIARWLDVDVNPALLVLGACASGAIAIGLAARWLEAGACDLAFAGGFDALPTLVAAGFESLRAITASPPPRPFSRHRDGMALGEGAGVLALVRRAEHPGSRSTGLCGFGMTCDAGHLTAPDEAGVGLSRAALRALAEAGSPTIDLVSAHATSTPLNDVAEFAALTRALGDDGARRCVVHPLKAQIGHTMGAAGALELLAAVEALDRAVMPAAVTSESLDPAAPARLLARAEPGAPSAALKLSSAFGGANVALVLRRGAVGERRQLVSAYVHGAVHVSREPPLADLAQRLKRPVDRIARGDELVWLSLAAVAALEDATGPLAGSGIVVGTTLATLETNVRFAARIRERGALAAEPRLFPYTSPNAVAGECAIAFGLTGPGFCVGSGTHAGLEALSAAALLVQSRDTERMVVVAADFVGPATRALAPGGPLSSGAVALLLSAERAPRDGPKARARVVDVVLRRCRGALSARIALGHQTLLPIVGFAGGAPLHLVGSSPPDAWASVTLEPV
jgi:3-oxoacyl-[acyl-carrier-protein] synthase II